MEPTSSVHEFTSIHLALSGDTTVSGYCLCVTRYTERHLYKVKKPKNVEGFFEETHSLASEWSSYNNAMNYPVYSGVNDEVVTFQHGIKIMKGLHIDHQKTLSINRLGLVGLLAVLGIRDGSQYTARNGN